MILEILVRDSLRDDITSSSHRILVVFQPRRDGGDGNGVLGSQRQAELPPSCGFIDEVLPQVKRQLITLVLMRDELRARFRSGSE